MQKKRINNQTGFFAGLISAVVFSGVGCAHRPLVIDVEPAPYVCVWSSGPIVIDGKLDDAAWQTADVITSFYAYSPKDATNLSPTEAQILWDSENIYVAITCMDADIWSYSEQLDDELYLGDVGELFLKPDHDSSVYYEFVMAPNGTLYDGRYPSRGAGGRNRFKAWSSAAKVSSFVNGTSNDATDMDEGYMIEMAIPLSAFQGATSPADGVRWTFGFFRYDYSKLFDDPLLLMSIPESLSNGFHYYEGYADLVFRGIPR